MPVSEYENGDDFNNDKNSSFIKNSKGFHSYSTKFFIKKNIHRQTNY